MTTRRIFLTRATGRRGVPTSDEETLPRRSVVALFLKGSALAMVGAGSAPLWLQRAVYAQDSPSPRKKVLVAIFQRGAVDGLNVVVPFGEARYYDMRPTIAIPAPNGTPETAIDLDGFFGLHPSLAPLKPIY